MADNNTVYGDISPRTAAYADKMLLAREVTNNILGQFGQVRPIPKKHSKTIKFRRYNKLTNATVPIVEGVTPDGSPLTNTDVEVTLKQYGAFIRITDVIEDTHEDPVLAESIEILGEQSGATIDVLRAGILKAGTNVVYANGTARTDVNTAVTRTMIRTVTRILKAQEAKTLSQIIKAGPNIGTFPIPRAFIAVCHSDTQPDWEQVTGWLPVQQYPQTMGLIEGESGSVGEVRVVFDNNLLPWADAGGNYNNGTYTTLTTTGVKSDVYPVLIFGKDAYGVVPLGGSKGKGAKNNNVRTTVSNAKPSDSDPLGQRTKVGWKAYNATIILNDDWMARLEVAARG